MLSVASTASQSCCQPWKQVAQHKQPYLVIIVRNYFHTCACATIRGLHLFRSELLIVWVLFGVVYIQRYNVYAKKVVPREKM